MTDSLGTNQIRFGPVERLVVRTPNWVGDAVLSTPAVRAIRTNFPNTKITLLAKPWVAPIYQNNPDGGLRQVPPNRET